jgi:hypothetical protein
MSKELAILEDDRNDKLMGEQFTAQYERATGGMREVLIFAAMMMKLRLLLSSARGTKELPRGVNSDGGIKAWLVQHAKGVDQSTAYRFESVGKSVAFHWDGLPETLAKKIEFHALVTSTAKQLAKIDGRLPKKQADLFEYVKGTSQRSWLDQFRETLQSSYDRTTRGKGKTRKSQARMEKDLRERCVVAAEALHYIRKDRAFYVLNEAELDGFIERAEEITTDAKAWRKKTKREREEIANELLAEYTK